MVFKYIAASFVIAYQIVSASILVFFVGFVLYALLGDRSHFREKMKSTSHQTIQSEASKTHEQKKCDEDNAMQLNPKDNASIASAALTVAPVIVPELGNEIQEEDSISRLSSIDSFTKMSAESSNAVDDLVEEFRDSKVIKTPDSAELHIDPTEDNTSLQLTLPVEVVVEDVDMDQVSPERNPPAPLSSSDLAGQSISRLPRVSSPRRSSFDATQRENVISPEKHPAPSQQSTIDEIAPIPPPTNRSGSPRSQQGLKPTEIVLQSRQGYASPLRGRSMNGSASDGRAPIMTPNPVAKRLISPLRQPAPSSQPAANSVQQIDTFDLIGKEVLVQAPEPPSPAILGNVDALAADDDQPISKRKSKSPRKKAKPSPPATLVQPPNDDAKLKERERQVEEARAAAKARILQKAKEKARIETELLERQKQQERMELELLMQAKKADQRRAEQGRYEAIMRLKSKAAGSSSSSSPSQINSPKLSRAGSPRSSKPSTPKSSQKGSPKTTRAGSPRSSLTNSPRSTSPIATPAEEDVTITLSPRTEQSIVELISESNDRDYRENASSRATASPSRPLALFPTGEESLKRDNSLTLLRPSSLLADDDSVSKASLPADQDTIVSSRSATPMKVRFKEPSAEDVKVFERDLSDDEQVSEEDAAYEAESREAVLDLAVGDRADESVVDTAVEETNLSDADDGSTVDDLIDS